MLRDDAGHREAPRHHTYIHVLVYTPNRRHRKATDSARTRRRHDGAHEGCATTCISVPHLHHSERDSVASANAKVPHRIGPKSCGATRAPRRRGQAQIRNRFFSYRQGAVFQPTTTSGTGGMVLRTCPEPNGKISVGRVRLTTRIWQAWEGGAERANRSG